jgi:hypothetical protein
VVARVEALSPSILDSSKPLKKKKSSVGYRVQNIELVTYVVETTYNEDAIELNDWIFTLYLLIQNRKEPWIRFMLNWLIVTY